MIKEVVQKNFLIFLFVLLSIMLSPLSCLASENEDFWGNDLIEGDTVHLMDSDRTGEYVGDSIRIENSDGIEYIELDEEEMERT